MSIVKAKHVETSLEDAITSINRAVTTSSHIQKATDVPAAFKIVAKRLPLVSEILVSIKSHFAEHPDTYPDLRQMADDCRPFGRHLDELFEVAEPDDSKPLIERYRSEVGKGDKIEDVMKKLLIRIGDVVKVPLVSEDQLCELKAALKEVKNAPPSLEDAQSGHIFNNNSNGIQPIHLGEGHVNISHGSGPQINSASGGHFHFAPPPSLNQSASV
ncbi:hypothetical protein NM208_g1951 [Fusarium decemcellulare]|uniref:Uncharacterized protein n=2 Tax=Fusarium decemcellulare TaxID=57161 RepID=A0ACC1SUE3_9HYPO|nr:hypothetical protein NM208_g3984 [Fusarium decemcellulare]KAJ3546534.1 hypothetical protein NM208_g1951 [Fusarium decemcellulare]